ncbi:MAG: PEPxxWA-CTERM sorting domain-containing protein [Phenylobacterium sp.]
MKTLTTLASAAVLAASIAAAAVPAHAAEVLFASFNTGTSNALDLDWVRNGDSGKLFTTATPTANSVGATAVKFTFLGDPALPDFDSLKANFTLSANVVNTTSEFDGSTYTQTGLDNGTFNFIYEGTTQVLDGFSLVHNVTSLLSGTFNNAWLQGAGGVGGLDVSISNGGNAHFVSSIYNLSHVVPGSDEFTLHLGNVSPNFSAVNPSTGCVANVCSHIGNTDLNSFRAHIGGDFQDFQLTVPEPTTWALMIMGFGGAGAMLRRRRASAIAA